MKRALFFLSVFLMATAATARAGDWKPRVNPANDPKAEALADDFAACKERAVAAADVLRASGHRFTAEEMDVSADLSGGEKRSRWQAKYRQTHINCMVRRGHPVKIGTLE